MLPPTKLYHRVNDSQDNLLIRFVTYTPTHTYTPMEKRVHSFAFELKFRRDNKIKYFSDTCDHCTQILFSIN